MLRYPIFKQDNEYSCGAYCIKMILKYYHLDISIKEIKQLSKITSAGISVYGMVKCLAAYHIDAKAYQCDYDTLIKEAKLPCIIHVLNDEMTHYCVLYKVSKKYVLLGDPAKGLVKLNHEQLKAIFTGICICNEHVGRYAKKENKEVNFKEFILLHLKDNYQFVLKLVSRSMLISICSILSSSYFQSLIDQIEMMEYWYIVCFTLFFALVSLIKIVVDYSRKKLEIDIQRYLNQIYVNKTVINMLNLPLNYFQNSQDGILMSKVQNLFQFSEFFIHLYSAMFIDLILLIGLFIALTIYSVSIALITSCFFIVIAFLLFRYLKQINSMNKKIISSQEIMNQGHLEYLRNIYNSHQFFVKSFARNKINFLFEDYNYFLYRRNNALNRINGISELLIGMLLYSVVLIACFYYKQARLSVGEIVFFYLLISYMIEPLFNIISFVLEKDEVLILFERYRELLPEKKTKKMYFKGPIKQIKFDHISYSYGYSKPIIEHLDLTITKSIWLKGDTGAGKSTLLKLLMNYDQLLKGKILINGIDLQKIDVNSLYQKMIYLDKEPIFYRESLRFNLLLNRHNEKMMNFLLKEFKMEEFINKLDMVISDDGHPLSSGQAQIMMLIRSLLKRPQVLILDEALCNVDETRLMLIMEYLKHLDGKLIVIIVAHQTKLMNELFDYVIIEHGKIRK